MKKNAIIYIDDTHAQVTKAFEKQARIFVTPEYREWKAPGLPQRSDGDQDHQEGEEQEERRQKQNL